MQYQIFGILWHQDLWDEGQVIYSLPVHKQQYASLRRQEFCA